MNVTIKRADGSEVTYPVNVWALSAGKLATRISLDRADVQALSQMSDLGLRAWVFDMLAHFAERQ